MTLTMTERLTASFHASHCSREPGHLLSNLHTPSRWDFNRAWDAYAPQDDEPGTIVVVELTMEDPASRALYAIVAEEIERQRRAFERHARMRFALTRRLP